jgi:hypothetical protein
MPRRLAGDWQSRRPYGVRVTESFSESGAVGRFELCSEGKKMKVVVMGVFGVCGGWYLVKHLAVDPSAGAWGHAHALPPEFFAALGYCTQAVGMTLALFAFVGQWPFFKRD